MTDKLEACPLCGGETRMNRYDPDDANPEMAIDCEGECQGIFILPKVAAGDWDGLRANWNTRTPKQDTPPANAAQPLPELNKSGDEASNSTERCVTPADDVDPEDIPFTHHVAVKKDGKTPISSNTPAEGEATRVDAILREQGADPSRRLAPLADALEPAISHPVRGGQYLDFGNAAAAADSVERARFLADIGKRKNMPIDSVGELLRLINGGANITRIAALSPTVPDEPAPATDGSGYVAIGYAPKGHLNRYLRGKDTGCWIYGTPTADDNDTLFVATQPSTVAGDCVVVPREPTEAMLDVMHDRVRILVDSEEKTADIQNDREVWSAMLVAAASPAGGE